ncbi:MAG: metallophosphoesterase family protein, partial [Phycisphaeraceae bacterium]|nr:metallophosphoesterase family protein [Phycisphaeraceae bacterium]
MTPCPKFLSRFIAIFLFCLIAAQGAVHAEAPRHLRIIWIGDATSEATVSWSTLEKGSDHKVYYRPRNQDQPAPSFQTSQTHQSGPYTGGEGHYHHVALNGLKPDTLYEIQVASDGDRSDAVLFRTAPRDPNKPVAILSGGDSRSGHKARVEVNKRMAELCEDPTVIAFAHGGDFIQNGRKWSQWDRWLKDHQHTRHSDGRVLPIIPTRGNHDKGVLFDEIFAFPGGKGKNYFTTRIGPSISLITLNTSTSAGGEQLQWLKKQLPVERKNSRWLLVQYHRPIYPAVKSPGRAKSFWAPL